MDTALNSVVYRRVWKEGGGKRNQIFVRILKALALKRGITRVLLGASLFTALLLGASLFTTLLLG